MLRKSQRNYFDDHVLARYQVYNSIFLTLPFDKITNTGVFLPLFTEICKSGYAHNENPTEIVDAFFKKFFENPTDQERISLLFRFIQYIERQVVLFDAIEDAAFPIVNNMEGRGMLRSMKEEAESKNKTQELKEYLRKFRIRTVLTAHPTQFYPGPVLGIITDLSEAVRENDLTRIKKLLAQLGKTPFFKKEKPTPFDEAVSLVWYLENVFYHAISKIYNYIQDIIFEDDELANQVINLGFWPGGDRDGNPYVTADITLRVADRLKTTILKNYYRDIRKLKRKITFIRVDKLITDMEMKLHGHIFNSDVPVNFSAKDFLNSLRHVKDILVNDHQSLYVEEVNDLINKVKIFGFHFASIDIRQDSRVHTQALSEIVSSQEGKSIFPKDYTQLSESEQVAILSEVRGKISVKNLKNEVAESVIDSMYAMKTIQQQNGEFAANRYIISNTQNALNVMEVFAMIHLCDWEKPAVDIIPLFETVDDLLRAGPVMETLYTTPAYVEHLRERGNKQTIMLGFSDGTKDGGYLMANWSIYQAKAILTEMSRKYEVDVVFFDGRGGPPARGGGKTHQFYASLGTDIENEEIQLTVQGQTISSNFGTLDSCRYNLEQLLSSGISSKVFAGKENLLQSEDRETIQRLADVSYQAYTDFKNHPMFMPYLERISTLKYYAKTNIGSRPSKRGKSDKLEFSDLRAIPFVGSWSQLKQNVPGFFGVGTAIEHFEKAGEFDKVQALYDNSLFFRTLIENSMMSLSKSFFKLTAYMQEDSEFGDFWRLIYQEYELTKRLTLKVTGYTELMQDSRNMAASVREREGIVLPLITIQQYALRKIQELQKNKPQDDDQIAIYEKMVTRSLFGNINASRNSA